MKTPSLLEMLQAGVHFGHQVSRWHPKMKRFIFAERNGVHILDLEQTQTQLEQTLEAVKAMAAEGKQILFATTKPQAREVVKEAALDCGMPYLTGRWIGGLLTNFTEIKKLLNKYNTLKEQQASGELERYTKKEQVRIGKELEKMDVSLQGLATLTRIPDAIFIPAMQREKTAVVEANRMNVPIIGICDTNANPDKAAHVIPANDDAVKAITMMVGLVGVAAKEGRAAYDKKAALDKKVKDEAKAAPKKAAPKTEKKEEKSDK